MAPAGPLVVTCLLLEAKVAGRLHRFVSFRPEEWCATDATRAAEHAKSRPPVTAGNTLRVGMAPPWCRADKLY